MGKFQARLSEMMLKGVCWGFKQCFMYFASESYFKMSTSSK